MKRLFLYCVLTGLLFTTPTFAQIKTDISDTDPMNLIGLAFQFWENAGAKKYPYPFIGQQVTGIAVDPTGKNPPIQYLQSFELKVCSAENDPEEKDCKTIIFDFNKMITFAESAKKGGYTTRNPKPNEFAPFYMWSKYWELEKMKDFLLPTLITEFKDIENKNPQLPRNPVPGTKNNSNFITPIISSRIDASVRVHVDIFGSNSDIISSGVIGPCVKITDTRFHCTVITAAHVLGGAFFENAKIELYKNGVSQGITPVSISGRDYDNDLALLFFETNKPLIAPTIADDTALHPGMRGLTQVGCPQGNSSLNFLNGTEGCTVIQCATSKNPRIVCSPAAQGGRSGGPLFTPDGKLAGITLSIDKENNKTFYASGDAVAQFVKNNMPSVTMPTKQQAPTNDLKNKTEPKKDLQPEEIKRLNDRIDRLESQLETAIKLLQERNK